MSHANAALTPRARLRLARLVVEDGWSVARAAERYDVSWPTAKRWADRYRAEGPAGMTDRSSRPHRQPSRTPHRSSAGSCTCAGSSASARSQIGDRARHAGLDRARRAGPLPAQPAHPRRPGHRRAGPPLRARAPRRPVHVDVKKLGNIPDGGGWRYVGRQQGDQNRRRHRAGRPPRASTTTR